MQRNALIVVNRVADTFSSRLPLVDLLRRRGYAVTAAGAVTSQGRAVASSHGIDLVDLGYDPFEHSFGRVDLAAGGQLRKLAQNLKPAVTFVFNSRPILLLSAWLPRRSLRNAVMVVTGRGRLFNGSSARQLLTRILWSLAASKARRVVFQNEADLDLFVGRGFCKPDQATIVPSSGVSAEKFLPLAKARQVPSQRLPALGYAGRYLVSKGVRSFFRVARELRDGGFTGRIIMAGSRQPDDPDSLSEDELKTALQECDIEDLDYVTDMREFYKLVDVFLYPSSYGEGVARVLIEAALSGCACLAWDSGGAQAVLRGVYDEGLVPEGDNSALAARTQQLLGDNSARLEVVRRLSAAAAKKFDIPVVIGLYAEILEDVERSSAVAA